MGQRNLKLMIMAQSQTTCVIHLKMFIQIMKKYMRKKHFLLEKFVYADIEKSEKHKGKPKLIIAVRSAVDL